MTRINCIPVDELVYDHLLAEYRELPRVYGYVKARVAKGQCPEDVKIPKQYTLGTGHVTFFYDKLDWINNRYLEICNRLRSMGTNIQYGDLTYLVDGIPQEWFGSYSADNRSMKINRERIINNLEISRLKAEEKKRKKKT